MRIQPNNLTLALIYRDRLLTALGVCMARQRLCPARVAAQRSWVPPTLKLQADWRATDAIVPAEWPYVDAMSVPATPPDMPYQPHVIPPKDIRGVPESVYRRPGDISGRLLDVFA